MKYFSTLRLPVIMILIFLISPSCKKDNPDTDIKEVEKDIFASVEHLGVCYGPFHYKDQNDGSEIPKSQIEEDLALIAKNFDFFRTYTVASGMDKVVEVANEKGLEVALGVHCYPDDASSTKSDIDKAVQVAKQHPSVVMCIVIGNETNSKINDNPNYVKPTIVAGYMDYAHEKMVAAGLTIPLTACITGTGADEKNTYPHEDYAGPILQKCKDLNKVDHRIVLLNIYPYFAPGSNPANIDQNMIWSYGHGMSNAEDNFGLEVIIGEIGWPSAKDSVQNDRESIANMEVNFKTTLSWVDGKNSYNKSYNSFWFEMFDEPWKKIRGPVEPYWGLYAKDGATTPKFTIPPLQ